MNSNDDNLDELLKALTNEEPSELEADLLEDSMTMTEEEIENLLQKNQSEASDVSDLFSIDADDLSGLLANFDDDEEDDDIKEISELLEKSENNEAVNDDLFSLLQGDENIEDIVYNASDLFSEEEEEKPKKKKIFNFGKKKDASSEEEIEIPKKEKKEKKTKKAKKEKASKVIEVPTEETVEEPVMDSVFETIVEPVAELEDELFSAVSLDSEQAESLDAIESLTNEMVDNVVGTKKKGFFQRFFEFLTAEDEPELGEGDLHLTDVDDVKKVDVDTVDVTDESIDKKKEAKEKKAQEKKEKKERAKREREASKLSFDVYDDEALTGKKLSKKNVGLVFVVCLVPMLALILVSNWYMGYTGKRGAVKAYYAGDYMQCYQLLYGQKMNESQQLMFHRSEMILRMERIEENIENFINANQDLEALDRLVQYMSEAEDYYEFAKRWNCVAEYQTSHEKLLKYLEKKYSVSPEEALYVAAIKSDVEYTRAIYDLLHGKEVLPPSEKVENTVPEFEEPKVEYDDMLPEEEERQQADS